MASNYVKQLPAENSSSSSFLYTYSAQILAKEEAEAMQMTNRKPATESTVGIEPQPIPTTTRGTLKENMGLGSRT